MPTQSEALILDETMANLKMSSVVLGVVILAASCIGGDDDRPKASSSSATVGKTPVKAARPTVEVSPAVEAAKETLQKFMFTPGWRDREVTTELHKAVAVLGDAGEAGIDVLKELSTSNNSFIQYDAMRAIVRSGSKRGPAIASRFMAATQSTLSRRLVVWQMEKMIHLPREMRDAYAAIVVSEIWRSREPRCITDDTYLHDLVRTLEALDGKTYWEDLGGGGMFREYSNEELQRAVRRCLPSRTSLTGATNRPESAVSSLQSQFKSHSKNARLSNDHASIQAGGGDLPKNAQPRVHQYTSASLDEAWDRIRRAIPEKEGKESKREVDGRLLQRFLGFLEGRLRVNLPKQWERSVGAARAFHRDNIVFDVDRKRRMIRGTHGFYLDRQNKLNVRRNSAELVVDRVSIGIPMDAYKRLTAMKPTHRCSQLSVLVSGDRCFIANYANTGTPFFLLCLNRTSNEVEWQSEAKGSGVGAYLGVGSHAVYLAENDESIVAFGVEGISIHIEGFDKKSGRRQFWFSSATTAGQTVTTGGMERVRE
jgi:hypothetical protein